MEPFLQDFSGSGDAIVPYIITAICTLTLPAGHSRDKPDILVFCCVLRIYLPIIPDVLQKRILSCKYNTW